MAERAFYVDLTRQGPTMGFAKCRTWRTPRTYAEYVADFPKCVTTTWLETLSGDEAEQQARIRYAVLVKQVAVMQSCHEPGNRPVYTASSLPEGVDVFDAVAQLEVEHERLRLAIERGEHCAGHEWKPPASTVAGFYDSPAAGEGAKDEALWEQCRAQRFTLVREQDRDWTAADSAWVTATYHRLYAEKNGISVGAAADSAWKQIKPETRVQELLDISQPDGDSFKACGPRDRPKTYVEYVAKFPKCLNPEKLGRMLAKPDAELRVEYAILSKQVAVMEKCFAPGMSPVYVRTDPRKGTNLQREVEVLRKRHAALSLAIDEGKRCQVQLAEYTTGAPPVLTPMQHYLTTVEQLGLPANEAHVLELQGSVLPPLWYVDQTFASLGRTEGNIYDRMVRTYEDRKQFRAHVLQPKNLAVPGGTLVRDLAIHRQSNGQPMLRMWSEVQPPAHFLATRGVSPQTPGFDRLLRKLERIDRQIELRKTKGVRLSERTATLHQILQMEQEIMRQEADIARRMEAAIASALG